MNKQTALLKSSDAAETAELTSVAKRADGRNWTRTILMLIVPALLILGGG